MNEQERLAEIRESIENECVSYGELVELSELREFIAKDDVLLLEWSGVPEFPEEDEMDRLRDLTERVIEAEVREQIRERQLWIAKVLLVKRLLKEVVWNE